MTSRDIERLRALEKRFQDEASNARDTFKYGGGEYYDGRRDAFNLAASELASLIAELGQEVGAVADTVGVLTVRRWRGIDAMVNHEFEYLGDLPDGTYSLFTSPAHASEARDAIDAARYRFIAADRSAAWEEELDAAMRQEGGSDAG